MGESEAGNGEGPSPEPRATIIIPVYNRPSLTRQCLNQVLATLPSGLPCEVVVVDDGSGDRTKELLKSYGGSIRVVTHPRNIGFAGSCNDGASTARAGYLIFLNNDTIPRSGWLESLVEYADAHPRAAVVGAKLLYPNDTVQHAGVVVCQDQYLRHVYLGFPADHPAVNVSRRFQLVTAACVLIRREAFEATGGFDRAFTNGFEDMDLCFRLGESGYEIHYCHTSVLYHLESVSQGRFEHVEGNTRLYEERWRDRVMPDDLGYYVEDGLLNINYEGRYPVRMSASPLLAVRAGEDEEDLAGRLLDWRSHQVQDLLNENLRLLVNAREAGAGSALDSVPAAKLTAPALDNHVPTGAALLFSGKPSRGRRRASEMVSIIVPVKNGASQLRETLPAILKQQGHRIEIIAIDSGSEDDSVEVLRKAGATVLSIEPRSFNHGLTRKLGADHAQGRWWVFVNQGTLPADEHWLENLVAPLRQDEVLAGVCSRVLPRDDADLLTRRDGLRDVSAAGERRRALITDRLEYTRLTPHELRLFVNFHTVSAAVRPEVFKRIPFRQVRIGEDILWAKEVLEAGHAVQHEPSSVVLHSHEYSYLEVLQRNVDDGSANREIVGRRLPEDEVVPLIESLVRDDWRYLESELGLDGAELERWRLASTLHRASQIVGLYIGVNHEALPGDLASHLSLMQRIKIGAGETARETVRA